MYSKILVALENDRADDSLLPHVTQLAKIHKSKILLIHVADGWVARNYDLFQLAESDEMKEDQAYLDNVARQLQAEGLEVRAQLALGNPPEEILKIAKEEQCDLIAMTSHGHRFFADLFFGSTIEEVRHQTDIPLLIVKMNSKKI